MTDEINVTLTLDELRAALACPERKRRRRPAELVSPQRIKPTIRPKRLTDDPRVWRLTMGGGPQ